MFTQVNEMTLGRIELISLNSQALAGNVTGESAVRSARVYLPPGYDSSDKSYPVIYWLHGFGSNDRIWMEDRGLKDLLDLAIKTGKIRDVIVVVSNQQTQLGGSFYVNSDATGKWEDFIVKELVDYMDTNFRTINNSSHRSLAGHSMGGNGAIRLAMKYQGVFNAVYAMSPAVLDLQVDVRVNGPFFKRAAFVSSWEEIHLDEHSMMAWAMAQAYSPDMTHKPFYSRLPVEPNGEDVKINEEVLSKWTSQMPMTLIHDHWRNLTELKALKIDFGSHDEFIHIPITCCHFADLLDKYNVPYEIEKYEGKHLDKLLGQEGRILNIVLPFFEASF